MKWNLDNLYTDFDSEEYENDVKQLDMALKDLSLWSKDHLHSLDNIELEIQTFLEKNIILNKLFSKLMSFSNLTSATDVDNEIANREKDSLRVKFTKMTAAKIKFQNFIKKLEDLDSIIENSKTLDEYKFYLKEIREQSKYALSREEEILISNMKNTGSEAWKDLQETISSKLLVPIEIDGEMEELPISLVRNMAYSENGYKRKRAYLAELEAYKRIEDSSAAALNGIKGEVITISEIRGYNSPLEKTLLDSRMDRSTLDAMILAIEEFLPEFHRYFKTKGKLLGHEDGLPFYDLFAPIGDLDMTLDYEETKEYIVKNFKSFSPKLSEFANNAFENNWIDVQPRQGKRGGAFCSNIHAIGESRILTNFTGNFLDMVTLAHELGHGYHGFVLKDESILNSDYPMPLAETASTFCETVIMKSALEDANKEEKLFLLESSLLNASIVIVDIYSRFLFEKELFRRRKSHSLSVEEIKGIMMDSQNKAYGDSLNPDYLHPYMWLNKPHYYYAERNFYNFPYAFGLLFAKGLYSEYLENKSTFVEDYDYLLSLTGKMKITDVARQVNIDVTKPDFFKQALDLIQEDIDEFIQLSAE